MKPESLLDPETLPDDLRWLATEFKLAPKDPVFLLIAWHWHRVKAAEDSLRAATVEFTPGSAADFQAYIRKDRQDVGQIVRASKVRLD